jgi:hypothetical protein
MVDFLQEDGLFAIGLGKFGDLAFEAYVRSFQFLVDGLKLRPQSRISIATGPRSTCKTSLRLHRSSKSEEPVSAQ